MSKPPIAVIVVLTGFAAMAAAQSQPVPALQERPGITSYLEFAGTSNSEGQLYELNSNVGYDFTSHFGFAVGMPIYFVRPSSTTGTSSANGPGDPYLRLHLKYPAATVNFASALTGSAPVGDSKKGLSTGRATFDWTNRIDHDISQWTPFLEAGIANTTPETRLFLRPYTTLGFNTHLRGGTSYDLWKFFSVGASGYDILPSGQQTIFSRVTGPQRSTSRSNHGRPFQNNQQTTGNASIAQDGGFSAWVDATPNRSIDLELGFTRSFAYDLNSVSFNLGLNLARLYGRNPK